VRFEWSGSVEPISGGDYTRVEHLLDHPAATRRCAHGRPGWVEGRAPYWSTLTWSTD